MAGFGVMLGLTGLALQLLAWPASCSQRVRMALPVPVESSETWLILLGLAFEISALLLSVF